MVFRSYIGTKCIFVPSIHAYTLGFRIFSLVRNWNFALKLYQVVLKFVVFAVDFSQVKRFRSSTDTKWTCDFALFLIGDFLLIPSGALFSHFLFVIDTKWCFIWYLSCLILHSFRYQVDNISQNWLGIYTKCEMFSHFWWLYWYRVKQNRADFAEQLIPSQILTV